MNYYVNLYDLKSRLGISVTTYDSLLEAMMDAASRYVEELARRKFYSWRASLYFDTGAETDFLLLPEDLLSVTSLAADSELDATYDGEAWAENTDYMLYPANGYPKARIRTMSTGSYALPANQVRYLKITGVWGFGNGFSAHPWRTTAITATLASAAATTITLSAGSVVHRGHTILVEDEQILVETEPVTAGGSTTATVQRGMNGTTAAAHSAKAVYLASYPRLIEQATMEFATRFYNQVGQAIGDYQSERFDDYSYTRFTGQAQREQDMRLVCIYQRALWRGSMG